MVDPFSLYRQPKVKRLLNQILMVVVVVIILYSISELMLNYNFDVISWLGSPSGVTMLVTVILGWVGYLMLNGKFVPPVDYQGKRPPQRKPQGQYQRPPQQYRPSEIQVDTCSFCGKQYPVKSMREFTDKAGYRLLVCNECLK